VWDSNGTIRAGTDGTVAAQWSHGVDTAVLGVELSRDEKRLLSWDDRGGVRIWDTATGRAAPVVAWTADGLRGAALGHDDRIVLTWGERGARLWDARSGRPLSSAYPGVGPVMGARLSDDGRALLVWTENGMRWWDFGADLGLVPAQALRRTELRTGTRLDRNGQIEVLSADAWLPLRVGLPPDADRR
jgi:WD40 repeat protein